jgi:hypothetical protein
VSTIARRHDLGPRERILTHTVNTYSHALNAVRTSLIVVVSVNLLVSLAIYGSNGNFNLFASGPKRSAAFYPNHRREMDIAPHRKPVLSKAVRR